MNTTDRFLTVAYVIAVLFLILLTRLWQLQILQGGDYRKQSEENRLKIVRVAAPRGIIFDRNGVPLVKNSPYFSVSLNPQTVDQIDLDALASLLQVSKASILGKLRPNRSIYEPVRIKEGLSGKEIAIVEARRSDFPGISIDIDVSRDYIYKNVGAHLIGYLGKLTETQAADPEFRDVPPDAFIGQWGVERLYDKALRGTAGERVIEVDAMGRELRLIQERPSERGDDIRLAMEINTQREAEEALGEKTGAIAAIRPDTGEILALASRPSFDPNVFAHGITSRQWSDLMKNPRQPMLNRTLQSQYPPGSTFKIVTAIAALEEKQIDSDTKATCRGGISYGRWHFGCWNKSGHGTVSVHRALVESCDVFFYEAGKRIGIDRLAAYARDLGLGKEVGVKLVRERPGLIPDTQWKQEKRGLPWYLGETFNASIGQGYVATTPFQMAMMTATVSNGGSVYAPSIVLLKDRPEPLRRLSVKPETLAAVTKGLCGVCNEKGGTGWAAHSSMATVCGKTGTAQVVGLRKDSKYLKEAQRDHAWFVSYAPQEKPEIALAVMVEHGGHGGGAAAPIAKRAIEAYLKSTRHPSVPAGPAKASGEEKKTEKEAGDETR